MRLLLASLLCCSVLSSSVHSWGETPDEVAQRSRSLLTDPTTFGVGILSTIYPDDYYIKDLRGFVTSGSDYYGPCYANGDLLVLALPVSQNWKNALTSPGKNATMTIVSNADPSVPDPRHETPEGEWEPSRPDWRKGMYSKQRLTLFGHLETLEDLEKEDTKVQGCYLNYHPDASHFAPGSKDSPHLAVWTRFVIDKVYRVGGYGDESQIGWLDLTRWQQAVKSHNSKGGWHKPTSTIAQTNRGELEGDFDRYLTLFGDNSMERVSGDLVFQA
ncbi:hypothetical protein CBS101457_001246 [Exobasidium rhododendri]|nr:hypothetical protein CBS101457_001246 [Exobasidium rhododendri]